MDHLPQVQVIWFDLCHLLNVHVAGLGASKIILLGITGAIPHGFHIVITLYRYIGRLVDYAAVRQPYPHASIPLILLLLSRTRSK